MKFINMFRHWWNKWLKTFEAVVMIQVKTGRFLYDLLFGSKLNRVHKVKIRRP